MVLDISQDQLKDLVGERIEYIRDWLPQIVDGMLLSETDDFLAADADGSIEEELMVMVVESDDADLVSLIDRYLYFKAANGLWR